MSDRIFCYKLPKGVWGQGLLDDIEQVFHDHGSMLILHQSIAPLEAKRDYLFPFGKRTHALVWITAQNTMRHYKDHRRTIAAYVCVSSLERAEGIGTLERALEALEMEYPLTDGLKARMNK